MQKIGLVLDNIFQKHRIPLHPESPYRLKWIEDYLQEQKLLLLGKSIVPVKADPADLLMVHSEEYVDILQQEIHEGYHFFDADTGLCKDSFETVLYCAGSVMSAVDNVIREDLSRVLCLIRPPGNHAGRERGLGFCLVNNVALGVRYLQSRYDIKNIIVIDFDVHHGNGTQSIFYEDDTVFYFSTHEMSKYFRNGSKREKGAGKGRGFNANFPLMPHSGEKEILEVYMNNLEKIFRFFDPEFIFISAGFDAHGLDPFSTLNWESTTYYKITRMIVELSQYYCEGRIISVLEGGYDKTGLTESLGYHFRALTGEDVAMLMDQPVFSK